MDPVNPWLDPADVRRLADRLLRPAIGPTLQHVADPGFGDHFEGFAPAASAARPSRSGCAASDRFKGGVHQRFCFADGEVRQRKFRIQFLHRQHIAFAALKRTAISRRYITKALNAWADTLRHLTALLGNRWVKGADLVQYLRLGLQIPHSLYAGNLRVGFGLD